VIFKKTVDEHQVYSAMPWLAFTFLTVFPCVTSLTNTKVSLVSVSHQTFSIVQAWVTATKVLMKKRTHFESVLKKHFGGFQYDFCVLINQRSITQNVIKYITITTIIIAFIYYNLHKLSSSSSSSS